MQILDLFESKLAMDKASCMARAAELGFTTPAYHGTTAKFNEFDFDRGKSSMVSGYAPHFTNRKVEAAGYVNKRSEEHNEKGRLLSCLLRIHKPLIVGDFYEDMNSKEFLLVSGGYPPKNIFGDDVGRYRTFDVAVSSVIAHNTEKSKGISRKDTWEEIYKRLKAQGYDAIIFKDTPADHTNGKYDKITMLDMSGIRLISAAFDPARAHEKDLRA